MVRFVAVDASLADRGAVLFNVGVAIEISGGAEFDEYYKEVIDEFASEHNIELSHSILKTSDVLESIPSYNIRNASADIVDRLLQNPAIERIYVLIGWYDEEVKLPWKEESWRGIKFSKSYLSQTFPIITLWKYWDYHAKKGDEVPEDAWVDNVQGQINGAWKVVGGEFEVKLVPHGDITYPSLSTADLIAGHLGRTLPYNRRLNELHKAAYGYLNNITSDSVDVQATYVNEQSRPMIVPDYPYPIKDEIHWPHPILFLHDEVFREHDRALARTDFHAYARKWAFENRGSVVKLQPDKLPLSSRMVTT